MNELKSGRIPKNRSEAHTARTKFGMGVHYGTGIRQPLGRMREGVGMVVPGPGKMKKPPKIIL